MALTAATKRTTTSLYLDEARVSDLNWAFRLAAGPGATWAGFAQYIEEALGRGHRRAISAMRTLPSQLDPSFSKAFEAWVVGPVARLVEPLDAYVEGFREIERAVPWSGDEPAFTHLLGLSRLAHEPAAWLTRRADVSEWVAPRGLWTDATTVLDGMVKRLGFPYQDTSAPVWVWIWRRGRLEGTFRPQLGPASLALPTNDHERFKRLVGIDTLTRIVDMAASCLHDPHYWLDPNPVIEVLSDERARSRDLTAAARVLVEAFDQWLAEARDGSRQNLASMTGAATERGGSRLQHALRFFRRVSWTPSVKEFDVPRGVRRSDVTWLELALAVGLDAFGPAPLSSKAVRAAVIERTGWTLPVSGATIDAVIGLLEPSRRDMPYRAAAQYHVNALVEDYLASVREPSETRLGHRPPHRWVVRSWSAWHRPLAAIWRWLDAGATMAPDGTVALRSGSRRAQLPPQDATWLSDLLTPIVPLDPRRAVLGDWSYREGELAEAVGVPYDDRTGDRLTLRMSIPLDSGFTEFVLALASERPEDARTRVLAELRRRVQRTNG